jgi:hypothetical protein
MDGRTENFTPGKTSPLGGKIQPWGTTSTLGSKYAHRGLVKNGPLLSTKQWTSFSQDCIPIFLKTKDNYYSYMGEKKKGFLHLFKSLPKITRM